MGKNEQACAFLIFPAFLAARCQRDYQRCRRTWRSMEADVASWATIDAKFENRMTRYKLLNTLWHSFERFGVFRRKSLDFRQRASSLGLRIILTYNYLRNGEKRFLRSKTKNLLSDQTNLFYANTTRNGKLIDFLFKVYAEMGIKVDRIYIWIGKYAK